MQIFHDIETWRALRRELPEHKTIGFVPTMGNLHAGHASLLHRSTQDNALTVASIFINPTQFNESNDYIHYPRTLEADLATLKACDVDFCLLPDEQAMYPDGYRFQVHDTQHPPMMETRERPGHFTGVLTVVLKLLQITRPHRAYFGEKDYQQLLLIQAMADAFFLDTTIIGCPTIREDSGLALSSRNHRLTPEERVLAEKFARMFHQPVPCRQIQSELEAQGITVDYVETYNNRRFAAVKIGTVRLIDNYPLPD